MPIYEYAPTSPTNCAHCEDGFEIIQKSGDAPVQHCPDCNAPVQRVLSAPSLTRNQPSLSESNIEKHGFTQYRKVEKGVYEKTTGKGPKVIENKDT